MTPHARGFYCAGLAAAIEHGRLPPAVADEAVRLMLEHNGTGLSEGDYALWLSAFKANSDLLATCNSSPAEYRTRIVRWQLPAHLLARTAAIEQAHHLVRAIAEVATRILSQPAPAPQEPPVDTDESLTVFDKDAIDWEVDDRNTHGRFSITLRSMCGKYEAQVSGTSFEITDCESGDTVETCAGLGAIEWYDELVDTFELSMTDDGLYPQDDVVYCDHCEEYHGPNTDMTTVYVRGGPHTYRSQTEMWCDHAVTTSATRCDVDEAYYSDSDYTFGELAGGGRVNADINADDLYYWVSDGCYHDEPEQEADDTSIPGYHNADRRHWSNRADTLTIGVELEVYCPDPQDCYDQRPEGMIAERDGSLDEYHGVEFIGPPLEASEYLSGEGMWDELLPELQKRGASSWDASGDYGMHVNIGRATLKSEHEAAFVAFINNNPDLSTTVAGRNPSRWAAYKSVTDPMFSVGLSPLKYSAVNVKPNVMEVRIFRGTLAPAGFRKNIEYCLAVLEFCGLAEWHHLNTVAFADWLMQPAVSERYPTLAGFLHRKMPETFRSTVPSVIEFDLPLAA